MASKHDLSTIFIVIIRLIDELCFSDDHVSPRSQDLSSSRPLERERAGRRDPGNEVHVSTNTHHHYAKYDWLRQVDGQVIRLTFI